MIMNKMLSEMRRHMEIIYRYGPVCGPISHLEARL
jgi:hypothetical protein